MHSLVYNMTNSPKDKIKITQSKKAIKITSANSSDQADPSYVILPLYITWAKSQKTWSKLRLPIHQIKLGYPDVLYAIYYTCPCLQIKMPCSDNDLFAWDLLPDVW